MHQGHNIPWNIISSNFHFVSNDTRFTPPWTTLMINNLDTKASNELKHFIRKFENAIQTFSETERRKYPQKFEPLLTGKLFSDELRKKYPEYPDERNQNIENWVKSARYTTRNPRLAKVMEILLYENQMTMILMLAQHPSNPLADLHQFYCGHNLGFSRVKDSALGAYMLFNVAEATGILENGKYEELTEMPGSLLMLPEIAIDMYYPAPQIPHEQSLRHCGVLGDGRKPWVPYGVVWNPKEGYIHADYARLQEHLTMLFELMYRCNMLLRECGVDPKWDIELALQFPLRGNVKVEWDESQQRNVLV